jgi:hypothetical protein
MASSRCYMLDFSVFRPPEELKMNPVTGNANAKQWSVSRQAHSSHRAALVPCPGSGHWALKGA